MNWQKTELNVHSTENFVALHSFECLLLKMCIFFLCSRSFFFCKSRVGNQFFVRVLTKSNVFFQQQNKILLSTKLKRLFI